MTIKKIQTILAAIACVGIVCPPSVMAAEATPVAKDVALRPGGVLVGQVVNQQGTAQTGSVVSIWQNEREVVRTNTDKNGIFAAQGLRGGQYQILTPEGHSFCRLWAADTAPPAASDSAVVVTGDELVRGQYGPPGATWAPTMADAGWIGCVRIPTSRRALWPRRSQRRWR